MSKKTLAAFAFAFMALGASGYTVGNVPAVYFLFGDTNNVCMTSDYDWVTVDRLDKTDQLTEENPTLRFYATVTSPDKTVVGWGEAPEFTHTQVKWDIKQSTVTNYTCNYDSSYTGSAKYLFVFLRYLQYTLIFNGRGGNTPTVQRDICYTNSVVLPSSTRSGYSFCGWTNAHNTVALKDKVDNLGEKLGISADGTEVTLLAKWKPDMYEVTFNANYEGGVSPLPSKMVVYDSEYGDLPALTHKGYEFDGWHTAKDDSGRKVYSYSTVTITNAHTLYAHWTPKRCRVTFNANYEGGSSYLSSTNIVYNTAYGELPQPVRTGYELDGWYTAAEGGTKVTSDTVMDVVSDHTLYAHWTPLTYEVTFDAKGGAAIDQPATVTYNSAYSALPTTTREGYRFDGWFTEGGVKVTAADNVTITSAQKLEAHWTVKVYKLYFDVNGEGGDVSPDFTMATYDSEYKYLPTPTRTGYAFEGWYTAADGGSKVLETNKVDVASDHSVYAHWSANTYKVKFDANGGMVDPSTNDVTYDAEYGDALPTPTRTGYTFAGWYTDKDGGTEVKNTDKVDVASDRDLYAHWSANSYKVTFDANGGAVAPSTTDVTYGAEYGTLPEPTFTGHTFAGWHTAADGGSLITSSSVVNVASNHTLCAHWTLDKCTVTLDPRGGTVSPSTLEVNYGTKYGEKLKDPQPEDRFVGWYTAAKDGVKEDADTLVTSNHTLYAHWDSDLSVVANCTNLILGCGATYVWNIDEGKGCDTNGEEDTSSSVVATNEAYMTTDISVKGTLAFRILVKPEDSPIGDLFNLYRDDVKIQYGTSWGLNDTATEWKQWTYRKSSDGDEKIKWAFIPRADKDDKCWVDQVHWYPNKLVSDITNGLGKLIDTAIEKRYEYNHEIIGAVLQNWDSILGDKKSDVTSDAYVTSVAVEFTASPNDSTVSALIEDMKNGEATGRTPSGDPVTTVTVTFANATLTFSK